MLDSVPGRELGVLGCDYGATGRSTLLAIGAPLASNATTNRVLDTVSSGPGASGCGGSGRPNANGVLFDRPNVIAGAQETVERLDVADRMTLVSGDFFESVPADGDLYLLSQILHDWDDEHCETLLNNIHRAASPNGKLLIVELVMPDTIEHGSPVYVVDLLMLVLQDGRERSRGEYAELLANTGFSLERGIPTGSPLGLIEAVRMD